MSLPVITIPVEIPFEVPLLLHPVVAHFAIAIPIIVLILEFSNLYFKRRALNVITLSFLVLTVVIFFGLYVTGKTDGSEAFPFLSDAGQGELKEHKLLGIYLVYASVLPLVFKAVAMLIMNKWVKIIYFAVLIIFIGVSLKQGKDGGELVFEHGANVKVVQEYEEKIEEFEDKIDELNEMMESSQQEETSLESVDEIKTEVSAPTVHSDSQEPVAKVMPVHSEEPAEHSTESEEHSAEPAEHATEPAEHSAEH